MAMRSIIRGLVHLCDCTYLRLHPKRWKLDKICTVLFYESLMPSKSMPPSRTFSLYKTHTPLTWACPLAAQRIRLSLSKNFYLLYFTFSSYLLTTLYQKIPKSFITFIVLFTKHCNQYPQLLVGSTSVSIQKVLQLIPCTWESSARINPLGWCKWA
jgi:hypothetical protein